MIKQGFILFMALFLISCRKDSEINEYAFPENQYVVIGHAYGNPVKFELRLYTKLIPILANIEKFSNPTQYIFTGDVVAKATEENWTNVLTEFDSLNIDNYWIAPGNHDLTSSYFEDNIQTDLFFSKRINNNLFLILNTNFAGWTVENDQLAMINSELNNLDGIQNIFVFSHQVWWKNQEQAKYDMSDIVTNAPYLQNGPTNFWQDAFPLFEKTDLPTYFFAGDVGAWDFIPAYVYRQFDNFHFYASGLGGGAEDNIINIKTFGNGNVEIDRIDF